MTVRFHDLFGIQWSKFHPYSALRCVPALALPLILSIAVGHIRPGSLITAGAFSVGFGSFQHLGNSRVRPMLLATLGMCTFSWIGTLAGLSTVAAVCVCGMAGFVYAVISRHSQGASWAAMQSAIWLVISTAYPAHGLQALSRGALILAGGLLQTGIVVLWWRIGGTSNPDESGGQAQSSRSPVSTSWEAVAEPAPRIFVIRVTVALAIATAIDRWLSTQNNYWIPMTVLIVLRHDHNQTMERGVARMLGTIAGAALASLIVLVAIHNPWVLGAGIVLFAWASYSLFYANYAYFAVCLTAYVVLLLSLAGISPHPLILHRIAFTAIGGALALVAALIKRDGD